VIIVEVPILKAVEDDLKQVVHKFRRWESLPLLALRTLPSIRFLADSDRYHGQPERRRSNAAVRQRIKDGMERTAIADDQTALTSLFAFDDQTRSLADRQKVAARCRGVSTESFRKKTEQAMLREFSEEIYRWELERLLLQVQRLQKEPLDIASPPARQ